MAKYSAADSCREDPVYRQQPGGGPHLLMAAQGVLDQVAAGEGLVDLHGGAARIGKHAMGTLPFQTLHNNVCPLPGFVSKPVHPFFRGLGVH